MYKAVRAGAPAGRRVRGEGDPDRGRARGPTGVRIGVRVREVEVPSGPVQRPRSGRRAAS